MKTRSIKKDIAIIGMSGKFPKSENILEFWTNLVEGNELIHFYSDSELEKLNINQDLINNKNYIKSSSFIEDAESFDYSFFGYTKEEAGIMDPQIRILHEQAWLSLEDAGYNPFNYPNKIGCFFSASDNLNWRAYVKLFGNSNINPFIVDQMSNKNALSTLISYALNLKGPSYFVDTACSSSLVAIHIACRSLLMKECSMALAGGVSISSFTNIGYFHEEGMIYSIDGHCKAFDIESSGTVPGEGAGVVVLKRLEDALNDRDHIYSIIRSSSVNNDGSRKIGYTAPSIIGQYECIRSAHLIAEVDAESISYIETHGTGTKLGDSVEIESLNKAFNYNTTHQCGIGSLKTNIGHLDAASGVASLIKTALSLKHKTIPPSLHFKVANPEINFKSGPFYVNSELKKWVSENPLLAGINSFGIGGTNAHAILQEPPIYQKGSESKAYQILTYSAKTKPSIERYEDRLRDFFKKSKNVDLADFSYTLNTGRNSFKYRNFIICKDTDEAQLQLDKTSSKFFREKEKKGIVFMFSGQGSQYYRMGKEIYLQFPYFKSIIDDGLAILKKETGTNYADIIGYNNVEEPSNDLINNTNYTQPLLFLLEYAFTRLLLKLNVRPAIMIGHSLGEYVAACISEVFTFEEGLKLILKRAHLMDKVESGAMLSVELSVDEIHKYITSDVSIAAINAENSCVISGNTNSINLISDILLSKEIAFARLKTSHAFHSQMMNSVLEEYKTELDKIEWKSPNLSFISCLTGSPIKKEEAMSSKYWVNHLRETVNFSGGLNFLLKEGYSTYIEIGPGKALTNILKQKKELYPNLISASIMKHPKEALNDSYYLLNALGLVWNNGIDINWNEYYAGEIRNKVSAPSYSFDKIMFPAKVNPIEKIIELSPFNASWTMSEDYSEWLYEQGWKEIRNESSKNIVFDYIVCFLNVDDFSEKLEAELIKENENIIFIQQGSEYLSLKNRITIDPSKIEDYEKMSIEIQKKTSGTLRIIHSWCVDKMYLTADESSEEIGYFSLLNIARTLFKKERFTSVHLDFLINDQFKVTGNEKISPIRSLALAALKVIPKEYENVYCKCIEFLMEDFGKNNFLSGLKNLPNEMTIAFRGNKVWMPFYEKIKVDKELLDENKIKNDGLYIITGSNGGIGKVIANFLSNEYSADLILIGRADENKDLTSSLVNKGNVVYYIQDDLSDLGILKDKLDACLTKFNKQVNGVFHAAGLADYKGLIIDRTKMDCQEIFLPKIRGTNNLFQFFKPSALDFIVLCSSTAAVLSPFGQVAYVASNMYQNFFAQEHSSKTKIISIQWDSWKESGMAVKAFNRHNNSNEELMFGITNENGINLIKYALNSKSPEIITSIYDLNSQLVLSQENTLKKAMESADSLDTSMHFETERPDINSFYKQANSETEKILCELWKTIFSFEKIGTNDDFFELGGDSLKAMTLVKKIHKAFNIEISIGDFFKKNNIEELAKEIDLAVGLMDLNKFADQGKKSNQIRL